MKRTLAPEALFHMDTANHFFGFIPTSISSLPVRTPIEYSEDRALTLLLLITQQGEPTQ